MPLAALTLLLAALGAQPSFAMRYDESDRMSKNVDDLRPYCHIQGRVMGVTLYSREGKKVLSCWYNCDAFVRYFPLCPGTGGR